MKEQRTNGKWKGIINKHLEEHCLTIEEARDCTNPKCRLRAELIEDIFDAKPVD